MDFPLVYIFPPFFFTGETCYCEDHRNEHYITESHLSDSILSFVNVAFFFNFSSND
jgi:hypothetical protein